jgi:hypothetical protein
MNMKATPEQKQFLDYFEKQGRPDLAYNADGSLKSNADLAKAAKELSENPPTKQLTANETLETTQAMETAKGLLGRMEEAKKTIAAGNYVGPLRGSIVGTTAATASSVAGNPQVKNAQRQLTMLLNDFTAEKTKSLKGSLSEKELEFIKASVPQLSDDEAVWTKFLNDRIPLLQKAIATQEKALKVKPGASGEATIQDAPPAPMLGAAGSAGAPAQRVLVQTQEEYDALAPGTPYRTADGTLAVKRGQ